MCKKQVKKRLKFLVTNSFVVHNPERWRTWTWTTKVPKDPIRSSHQGRSAIFLSYDRVTRPYLEDRRHGEYLRIFSLLPTSYAEG